MFFHNVLDIDPNSVLHAAAAACQRRAPSIHSMARMAGMDAAGGFDIRIELPWFKAEYTSRKTLETPTGHVLFCDCRLSKRIFRGA